MTFRPIIFSSPMVQALLAGRKTQTRRLASSPLAKCELGDLLYVRESFSFTEGGPINDGGGQMDYVEPSVTYMADDPIRRGFWKPSIHMPRWASRLTLEVTEVRRERLQEISRHDCYGEGIARPDMRHCLGSEVTIRDNARGAFRKLWDSLHLPPHAWADNPEIVALTFTVELRNVDAAR